MHSYLRTYDSPTLQKSFKIEKVIDVFFVQVMQIAENICRRLKHDLFKRDFVFKYFS